MGLLGLECGGWLRVNLSGLGIQVVGSSWLKKDYFETKKRWHGVVL